MRTGFRAALERPQAQVTEITDSSQVPWDNAEVAAPQLQDFLLQILDENSLLLVDKPALNKRGWKSWRMLDRQHAPSGGTYELDSMMALMAMH